MSLIKVVQEYWDRQPCNLKHSRAVVGSREYFEEVEKRRYFVEPHIHSFAEFEKWKDKEVLEIGCGIGIDSMNFAKAGAKLTVIDLSEKSLEIAKKGFQVFNLKAEFIQGNAEELSKYIKGKKFDLIYSLGVIHHSPNPYLIIKEIEKLIKPNGELRIMLYAKYSIKNLMIKFGLSQPEAQSGCPIAFTYSKSSIRKLLSSFDVFYIKKDHIFPYNISMYKKYQYVKKFPWNMLSDSQFKIIRNFLGWHFLVKAKYPG